VRVLHYDVDAMPLGRPHPKVRCIRTRELGAYGNATSGTDGAT
jgi:hypothetical protein